MPTAYRESLTYEGTKRLEIDRYVRKRKCIRLSTMILGEVRDMQMHLDFCHERLSNTNIMRQS